MYIFNLFCLFCSILCITNYQIGCFVYCLLLFISYVYFVCVFNGKIHTKKRKTKHRKMKRYKYKRLYKQHLLKIGNWRIKYRLIEEAYLPFKIKQKKKSKHKLIKRSTKISKTICKCINAVYLECIKPMIMRIFMEFSNVNLENDTNLIIIDLFNIILAILLFPLIYVIKVIVEDFLCLIRLLMYYLIWRTFIGTIISFFFILIIQRFLCLFTELFLIEKFGMNINDICFCITDLLEFNFEEQYEEDTIKRTKSLKQYPLTIRVHRHNIKKIFWFTSETIMECLHCFINKLFIDSDPSVGELMSNIEQFEYLHKMCYIWHDSGDDGSCLFNSVIAFLEYERNKQIIPVCSSIEKNLAYEMRINVCEYIRQNKNDPVNDDSDLTWKEYIESEKNCDFEEYLLKMEYIDVVGGQPEILKKINKSDYTLFSCIDTL